MKLALIFLGCSLALVSGSVLQNNEFSRSVGAGTLKVKPNSEENALEIEILGRDSSPRIHGFLGLSHPSALAVWQNVDCPPDSFYVLCVAWGDFAKLNIRENTDASCHTFEWSSEFAREIEDCYDLQPGVHWYGGGEMYEQVWPIERLPRLESAYVPSDSMADKERQFGGISERYWLLSNGATLVVDPTSPIFFSLNSTRSDRVCYTARDQHPYTKRSPLEMSYEWCTAPDVRTAHQNAIAKYFDKPIDIPDERMLIQPLWSTWAEYKEAVNQTIVLDYARRVLSEGFVNTSHIEIDDHWETCYGQEEFNTEKFPNARGMIDEIHAMGMRVTAWVHPFVNYECPLFTEGLQNGYFVKNTRDKMGITSWWQGGNSGLIDVTNPDAAQWWINRLRKLQDDTGMDSYKFDAGEVSWLPASASLTGDDKEWPQVYVQKFTETCSNFGRLIEVRAGHMNQREPIFVRILDKDSRWEHNNGLRALIPGLFQFGMNGYPFVLPDMIGGNNYNGETITQEFYMRWMHVNSFMPQVQFSVVPWRIGATEAERAETVRLVLEVLAIRERYAENILAAARQSVEDGTPMNRPLWWVDPTDSETFTIDDEYMLGDSILVAPVVHEGQNSRDIYLPVGTWAEQGDSSRTVQGPTWLRNYPAPVSVLPFFVKTG